VSLVVGGCQPLIEVVQPTPRAPLATVSPDERGVAIMGVDFDPPLDAAEIIANGGVTLLVAIQNQGRVVEPTVRITARLFDPEASENPAELMNETITVRALAPNEVRIVRFTQVTELPIRQRYKLMTEVVPVAGELQRDDNYRSYDILVHDTE